MIFCTYPIGQLEEKIILMRTEQLKVDMKQTYTSLATKIKNRVALNALLFASYIICSEFEEIFTRKELCDALKCGKLF